MSYILGIDEAGRGCVIGPLIIAGVLIDEKKEFLLRKLGVKDSKKLTHGKRTRLANKIKKLAKDILVLKIEVEDINEEMEYKKLNQIEIERMAEIINTFSLTYNISKIYIDAIERDTEKFKEKLYRFLNKNAKKLTIIAENKADDKYPVVSAASIIAKVKREEIIDKLKREYGDFGSGYSSDERTIEFLKKKGRKVKNILRDKWQTLNKLKLKDKRLSEY